MLLPAHSADVRSVSGNYLPCFDGLSCLSVYGLVAFALFPLSPGREQLVADARFFEHIVRDREDMQHPRVNTYHWLEQRARDVELGGVCQGF